MRRLILVLVAALVVVFGAPAMASAQQSVSLSIGGFTPHGQQFSDGTLGGRSDGDVLTANSDFLDFNLRDFRGATVNGEWLVGLGDKFDAGLGLGFYSRSTVASDAFSEFQGTGNPILSTLKLRVVPFTATIRWLPLGHHDGIQPYLGAGVGVFAYRYSETGDFVASDGVSIINGNFVGSGTTTGPVVLGGVRLPVGPAWSIGAELRYQSAVGNLPTDQGFATASAGATPKIDLGGFNYLFTMNVRF